MKRINGQTFTAGREREKKKVLSEKKETCLQLTKLIYVSRVAAHVFAAEIRGGEKRERKAIGMSLEKLAREEE